MAKINSMRILGLDEHPTEACFYIINENEQKMVEDIYQYFCDCQDLQQTATYCNAKGYRTKIRYTRPTVKKGRKFRHDLSAEKYTTERIFALSS